MLRIWLRKMETANAQPQPALTDPYLIACLRDGDKEALRIATVALVGRGLLDANGTQLKTRNADAVDLVNRQIEKTILRHYGASRDAESIFAAPEAIAACASYRKVLELHRLIAGPQNYARRVMPLLATLFILLGLCIVRVVNAVMQRRHNVGFLVVLAAVACIGLIVAYRQRLTGLGMAIMEDLKQLFERLKGRADTLRAGGETNEAALVAAVFGLYALPATAFPYLEKLYPRTTKSDSDGSSCGSSSSSCSSDSSSGGGRGGGCGDGD